MEQSLFRINKRLSKGTVSGLHVFNHVFDYVHENVWIERVYYYWYGKKRELVSYITQKHFYVHPKNGLLKIARNVPTEELLQSWNSKKV